MPKNDGTPRSLSPEVLQQLLSGLKPVEKGTTPALKGNQRDSMIAVGPPAYGRLPKLSIQYVRDAAKACGLKTNTPGALRAQENDMLPGYLVFEPVQTYDETAKDHYELTWTNGNRALYIDLMEILKPRNMVVPEGFVTEIPFAFQPLPDGRAILILHIHDAKTREKTVVERESRAGKSEVAAADEADGETDDEEAE